MKKSIQNKGILGDPDDSTSMKIEELGSGTDETIDPEDMDEVFKSNKEFDDARQQANFEILNELLEVVESNPQLRLGQILQNLNFMTSDISFVEPQVQLKRVKDARKAARL